MVVLVEGASMRGLMEEGMDPRRKWGENFVSARTANSLDDRRVLRYKLPKRRGASTPLCV